MQTFDEFISDKVGSEIKTAVASVETKAHNAIFSAMDIFVDLRMELAMRSVGMSLTNNSNFVVLDIDQRGFSGDTKNLQMTASKTFNSKANLNGTDGTSGNNTDEEENLPFGERSFVRDQTLITETIERAACFPPKSAFSLGCLNMKIISPACTFTWRANIYVFRLAKGKNRRKGNTKKTDLSILMLSTSTLKFVTLNISLISSS